jgi:8-oxo-dGTP pyrophosphatase MutT (NUDIX family)
VAALREAEEETGLRADGVEVFAELPELWLPPSNFAVTPVLGWWREESPVGVVDPREVHAVYRVPLDELLDPTHRVSVRHPSGWTGPGFLIGPQHDVLLWGFTAGIVSRLLDFLGWTRPWDEGTLHDLPAYMLQGGPRPAAPSAVPPEERT